jgi:hypothetical protein
MKTVTRLLKTEATAAAHCVDEARDLATTGKPSQFAREHIKATGHTVEIRRTRVATYGPKGS